MENRLRKSEPLEKIIILIPCYNEEKGIGKVIDNIPFTTLLRLGYKAEVIVIDNNSTDKTVKRALGKNVRVISEPKKGKGNAIRTGFEAVPRDACYIVMLDGDNTYNSAEIPRLIEPLANDFCDVIVGSRLGGKIRKNSLKLQNRIVNWAYTFLARQFYHANTTDVLSGYFAWKKSVIDSLLPHLTSEGFSIEMEMTAKIARLGYYIHSVPITYNERLGESKILALQDGFKILHTFFNNLFWEPKRNKPKRYRKRTTFIPKSSFAN